MSFNFGPNSSSAILGATNSLLLTGVSSGVFTQSIGASLAGYSVVWPVAQGATYSTPINNGQGALSWQAPNYIVSSSCGNFSTSNTGYTDVTNLSVSLTTIGRPVEVRCVADGSATDSNSQEAYFQANSGSNTCDMQIGLFVGASTLLAGLDNTESDTGPTSTFQTWPPSAVNHLYFPVAGTYTYRVAIRKVTGSSVGARYMKLIAREL